MKRTLPWWPTYRLLLDFAAKGVSLTTEDVFPDSDLDLLGQGHCLERQVTVPADDTLSGAGVHVRIFIIKMDAALVNEPALMLRIDLGWTSRFGTHESFAKYELDETDGGDVDCRSTWGQTLPYSRDPANAAQKLEAWQYHIEAVSRLSELYAHQMLSLVRANDDSHIEDWDLIRFLEWLSQQPEWAACMS